MWPVNLTDITKEHVKKKCPGMTIRYVPAGGTGFVEWARISPSGYATQVYKVLQAAL
jgi:hypothetical protein